MYDLVCVYHCHNDTLLKACMGFRMVYRYIPYVHSLVVYMCDYNYHTYIVRYIMAWNYRVYDILYIYIYIVILMGWFR